MTMIASVIKEGIPLMISDILMSQSTRPEHKVIFPTTLIDVVPLVKGEKSNYPAFFNRKTYIINDQVCISFAGYEFLIKQVLEDVKMFCRIHINVTGTQLGVFMANLKDEGSQEDEVSWEEFECIAHVIEKDGSFTRFYYKGQEGISEIVGNIVTGGSGYDDFLNESLEEGTVKQLGVSNQFWTALQTVGALISKILLREWFSLYNIHNAWGRGLEIVFANGSRFEKLDNVVYIMNYSKIQSDRKGDLPRPVLLLHYKYIYDVLFITSIKPEELYLDTNGSQNEISAPKVTVKIFPVLPFDGDKEAIAELVKNYKPVFTSDIIGMGYVFMDKTSPFVPASFHVGKELIVKYEEGIGLSISMAKTVYDTTLALTENVFRKNYL